MMADHSLHDVMASYKTLLDTADRSLAIARSLAEGYRAGLRPPDDVLDAYLARIERDEEQLQGLRRRMADLRIR